MEGLKIVKKIAFVYCTREPKHRRLKISRIIPCDNCLKIIARQIQNSSYIDTELIEYFAIMMANMRGDYVANRLTPGEFFDAFDILLHVVPAIEEKIKDATI